MTEFKKPIDIDRHPIDQEIELGSPPTKSRATKEKSNEEVRQFFSECSSTIHTALENVIPNGGDAFLSDCYVAVSQQVAMGNKPSIDLLIKCAIALKAERASRSRHIRLCKEPATACTVLQSVHFNELQIKVDSILSQLTALQRMVYETYMSCHDEITAAAGGGFTKLTQRVRERRKFYGFERNIPRNEVKRVWESANKKVGAKLRQCIQEFS